MIDELRVRLWLEEMEARRAASPTDSNETKRGLEETFIFLDELELRYPGARPPEELVFGAMSAVNKLGVITATGIRRVITDQEARLGLASTAPQVPRPPSGLSAFLHLLAERRGAYHWSGGTNEAFTRWLGGAEPLSNPLPLTARINCWEPLLAAAAEAGLLRLADLRRAYAQRNARTSGVKALLTQGRTVRTIQSPAQQTANEIRAGDVIMISGVSGPLHHVVAAVAEDRENYRNVRIMSLWNGVGGGGFTQTRLDRVLPHEACTIRYVSLTESTG